MKRITNISSSNVVIGGVYSIQPRHNLELEEQWITPEIATSIKANLDMHLIVVFEVEQIQPTLEVVENPEEQPQEIIIEEPVEEHEEVVEEKQEEIKEEIKEEKPKKTTRKASTKKTKKSTK